MIARRRRLHHFDPPHNSRGRPHPRTLSNPPPGTGASLRLLVLFRRRLGRGRRPTTRREFRHRQPWLAPHLWGRGGGGGGGGGGGIAAAGSSRLFASEAGACGCGCCCCCCCCCGGGGGGGGGWAGAGCLAGLGPQPTARASKQVSADAVRIVRNKATPP
jgi:hypothetical protein